MDKTFVICGKVTEAFAGVVLGSVASLDKRLRFAAG